MTRPFQVEEPGITELPQVLLARSPREIVAGSLDDEGRRLHVGEVRQEVCVRLSGRGLLVVVGVEAEPVEPGTGGLAFAVQCGPTAIVDAVEAGIEFLIAGEGVGRPRVDLQ